MYEGKRMQEKTKVILLLENGVHCIAEAVGITEPRYAELIFNTSMFGYEEIITDQSYAGQAIVFTSPHIGAVGCTMNDMESCSISPSFIVVRSFEEYPSNYRAQCSLPEFLEKHGLPVIFNVDTRYLTTILREEGALRCVVRPLIDEHDIELYKEEWLQELRAINPLEDIASRTCTVSKNTEWNEGLLDLSTETFTTSSSQVTVVVYDFGLKYSIVRILSSLGARCIVVPQDTPAHEVLAMNPDGICFSNGSGDPQDYTSAIQSAKEFLSHNIPLLGICLGHQIFGLALGAKTIKMKFGHHGANHPVQDCMTKKVYITSQNHGFAVDPDSLPESAIITHISLFDKSLQGFMLEEPPLFAFQGHPESSPGPHDIRTLFSRYMEKVMEYASRHSNSD